VQVKAEPVDQAVPDSCYLYAKETFNFIYRQVHCLLHASNSIAAGIHNDLSKTFMQREPLKSISKKESAISNIRAQIV